MEIVHILTNLVMTSLVKTAQEDIFTENFF